MKKFLLASFSIVLLFSCSKKMADKVAQTTPELPTPVAQPSAVQPKSVEIVEKSSIPEGIDPNLLVSLNRTPCFGSCPSYKVEIFEDGSVKYKGSGYVKRIGFFTAKADGDFIAQIMKQAASVSYMKFQNRYPAENIEIADLPQTISYVRMGKEGKLIQNKMDAPKELVAFERWLEKHIEGLVWVETKD
jgi:hypothetical protein